LFPQNPIFLDQVMDEMLLMLVHPTGQGYDEERKWVQEHAHCRRLSGTLSALLFSNDFNPFEFLHSTGTLLATRAGFNDAEYARDSFAGWAARLAYQPGRKFTPLVDTATQNWILRTVDNGWRSLRRSQDYYFEGALIWLRVDAIIRQRSNGRRSLDDFLRSFFGQRDTEPIVVPYTREDVEAGLAEILPYDWHRFFETRVYQVNEAPPTDGIEAAGWKLV
jgi:predicted metalloprotease with PDZ domain